MSMKFWNTTNGEMLANVDTDSQVCALLWGKHYKEIVSSHGFQNNQICVWKYGQGNNSVGKIKELVGH